MHSTTTLTANRCPNVTDRPIDNDLDPMSARFGSRLAKTVKTTINVIINSTPKACPTPTWWCSKVTPRRPCTIDGVTPYKIPAPASAPRHCAVRYKLARRTEMLRVTNIASVTAGLRWAPLMCPTHCTIVAADRPNAKATRTSSAPRWPASQSNVDPQPMNVYNSVISSSQRTDFQNCELRISSRTVPILSVAILDLRPAVPFRIGVGGGGHSWTIRMQS